jgi:hypothetical protein
MGAAFLCADLGITPGIRDDCDLQFLSLAICYARLRYPRGPTGCQYSVTFSEQPSVPEHTCGCQKMRRANGRLRTVNLPGELLGRSRDGTMVRRKPATQQTYELR